MRVDRVLTSVVAALAGLAFGAASAVAEHPLVGELRGVHADDFGAGSSDTRWWLDTGERTLRVLPTRLPALAPGAVEVEVAGRERDGVVVGSVRRTSPLPAPELGGRRVALIMFNFASNPARPYTAEMIREEVFTGFRSASAFFREESHGRLWLSGKAGNLDGDVYGWYTLDMPTSECPFGAWAEAADAAAAADGFSASQYQHVMYFFPGGVSSCPAAPAFAEVGGTRSWMNGAIGSSLAAHELGHNLGLYHASSWNCFEGSVRVTLSSNCTIDEYGDRWDVMGASGHHSHGWHLQRLGLLQPSNVQTITRSGTYSMTSALDPTPLATTLRIPRLHNPDGSVLDWYYLEIREQGGVFEQYFLFEAAPLGGVSMRVNDDPALTTLSKLLDTHPGTTSIYDAPLLPGETFSDGQVSITTVSAGEGNATVRITLPGSPLDTQAPSTPTGLSHSFTTGGAVRLQWNASSDDTGVTGYAVYRDGVEIASTNETSYEDTTALAGPHVYTVYADDAAGNRSAASQPHTVVVPGPQPTPQTTPGPGGNPGGSTGPGDETKPGGADRAGPLIRLSRRRLRGSALLLVARARDPSGVARLTLFIDGRRVRSVSGARLRYRWKGRPGRHRLTLKSVDANGNRTTVRLRVRLPG